MTDVNVCWPKPKRPEAEPCTLEEERQSSQARSSERAPERKRQHREAGNGRKVCWKMAPPRMQTIRNQCFVLPVRLLGKPMRPLSDPTPIDMHEEEPALAHLKRAIFVAGVRALPRISSKPHSGVHPS
jgi:hypothetical protein